MERDQAQTYLRQEPGAMGEVQERPEDAEDGCHPACLAPREELCRELVEDLKPRAEADAGRQQTDAESATAGVRSAHAPGHPGDWSVDWPAEFPVTESTLSSAGQGPGTKQMCRVAAGSTGRPPVRLAPEILIIDDEFLLRESLQEALEAAGYRAAVARNGTEALAMLDRMARPALLVLDLQMPLMDGLRFLHELRQRPDRADFEVLAMSAAVDGEWLERTPEVLRTLRKPFEVQELLSEAEEFEARHTARAGSVATATEQAGPVLGPETKAADPKEA
jgi:CheY-like chemotaxis protein